MLAQGSCVWTCGNGRAHSQRCSGWCESRRSLNRAHAATTHCGRLGFHKRDVRTGRQCGHMRTCMLHLYIRQKGVQTVIWCCQVGSRVAAQATTRAAPCLSRQTFLADCQSALDTLIPCPRHRHPAASASCSVAAVGPLSVGATLQAAASSVCQAS